MTDELALLRTIAASPNDAAPRGIYADWLDDQGRHEEAASIRGSIKFERRVEITPAFDKRPKKAGDPDYGIHGCELRMVLIGPKGATQFILYTNWMLAIVQEELDRQHRDHALCHPMPADVGYHSRRPMYEGDTPMQDECAYLGGGVPCYYDGSGLAAERMYRVLLERGSEGVWAELEAVYRDRFEGGE